MTHLAKTFFPLVGCHLVTFPLFTTRHFFNHLLILYVCVLLKNLLRLLANITIGIDRDTLL